MLLDALNFFACILFPTCCGVCGKISKNWICENCYKSLERLKINQNKISKKKVIYIFRYKGIIRNLIIKYKFNNCAYLSNLFAEIILNDEYYLELFNNYDYIIPVPMYKEKKKQRGYNQTELILNKIFENENLKKGEYEELVEKEKPKFKVKLDLDILEKLKNTKMQSSLSKTLRKENIKNAFLVNNKEKIRNKKIIIFDDIYTTGETTKEISRLLKECNVKEILIFVIAKD